MSIPSLLHLDPALIDQPTDSRPPLLHFISFSSRLFVLLQLSSLSCIRHPPRPSSPSPSSAATAASSHPPPRSPFGCLRLCPSLPSPAPRRGVAGSVVNPLSERMMGLLEECASAEPRTDARTDGRILQRSRRVVSQMLLAPRLHYGDG